MAWARIDDNYYNNIKIQKVGPIAAHLYNAGLIYCNKNLTDGFIDKVMLPGIAGNAFVKNIPREVSKLVEQKLWHEVEGGYQVNDFLDYNSSKAQVEETNKKRAIAGAKGGSSSKQTAKQSVKQVAKQNGKQVAKQSDFIGAKQLAPPISHNPYKELTPPTPPGVEKEAAADFGVFNPVAAFSRVTGMPAIPASEAEAVITALDAIWGDKGGTAESVAEYLRPYYEAWTSRRRKDGKYYSRTNCKWLTDWAVSGEIPPPPPEPEKPPMRKLRDPYGNVIEVPA